MLYRTIIEQTMPNGRNIQIVKKLNSYKYATRCLYNEDRKTSCVVKMEWFNSFNEAKRFGNEYLKGATI